MYYFGVTTRRSLLWSWNIFLGLTCKCLPCALSLGLVFRETWPKKGHTHIHSHKWRSWKWHAIIQGDFGGTFFSNFFRIKVLMIKHQKGIPQFHPSRTHGNNTSLMNSDGITHIVTVSHHSKAHGKHLMTTRTSAKHWSFAAATVHCVELFQRGHQLILHF